MPETKDITRESSLTVFRPEDKEKIEKEAVKKLVHTISYYMADPLTVLLGRAELLEKRLRRDGAKEKTIVKFVELCKEELSKIRVVLDSLREVESIKYKAHPLGFEMIDLERKIEQGVALVKEKWF